MRVAVAELTAGELTLMVVSNLQRAAQRSRHRARSAPDLQDCAVGSVGHQHTAGVAGAAAGRGRSEVNAIRLFDDRRAGGAGGVGCRRRCHRCGDLRAGGGLTSVGVLRGVRDGSGDRRCDRLGGSLTGGARCCRHRRWRSPAGAPHATASSRASVRGVATRESARTFE